uniref:Uncharacterized protein n=1 Tax=Bionectria ochroleuca TaxID=29856 RepID=A0A8H7TRW5_BIOOC
MKPKCHYLKPLADLLFPFVPFIISCLAAVHFSGSRKARDRFQNRTRYHYILSPSTNNGKKEGSISASSIISEFTAYQENAEQGRTNLRALIIRQLVKLSAVLPIALLPAAAAASFSLRVSHPLRRLSAAICFSFLSLSAAFSVSAFASKSAFFLFIKAVF